MSGIKVRRPSAALLVAVLALVMALGGGAVAGVTISKLSKKDKRQVKKIAKRLDKRAIGSIPAGPVGEPGPKGDPGPQGPQGAPGAGLTPAVFTSAGLPNLSPSGCIGSPTGDWYDHDPANEHEVGYHRSASGMVRVRGVAHNCEAITQIFTLPPGFRPERRAYFAAVTDAGGEAQVTIQANGRVEDTSNSGYPDNWVSLDGIEFRCGPAGANGCP